MWNKITLVVSLQHRQQTETLQHKLDAAEQRLVDRVSRSREPVNGIV
ncbi:TPA: hypothetical protein ACGTPM_004943 [Salmonella enterica]